MDVLAIHRYQVICRGGRPPPLILLPLIFIIKKQYGNWEMLLLLDFTLRLRVKCTNVFGMGRKLEINDTS